MPVQLHMTVCVHGNHHDVDAHSLEERDDEGEDEEERLTRLVGTWAYTLSRVSDVMFSGGCKAEDAGTLCAAVQTACAVTASTAAPYVCPAS
jgi:hypothetical protein